MSNYASIPSDHLASLKIHHEKIWKVICYVLFQNYGGISFHRYGNPMAFFWQNHRSHKPMLPVIS